jgi:hypothetical protein
MGRDQMTAPKSAVVRGQDVRLLMAEHPALRDHLHGAWWPRSADISRELPPLLHAVATRGPTVLGVALSRAEWPDAPLEVHTSIAGRVRVSWYGLSEPNLMVLSLNRQRKLALLVVPPDTREDIALTAMLMAVRPGNDCRATEVLAHAHDDAAAGVPRASTTT